MCGIGGVCNVNHIVPPGRLWAAMWSLVLGGRDMVVSLPLTTRRHWRASAVFCPVRHCSHGAGEFDSVGGEMRGLPDRNG